MLFIIVADVNYGLSTVSLMNHGLRLNFKKNYILSTEGYAQTIKKKPHLWIKMVKSYLDLLFRI